MLVVDDEAPARKRLRMLLAESRDVDVVGEAGSGAAAVDAIRDLAPDVVFLDIQMPEGDGFDVVSAIGVSDMPLTVFVTAFDEHAIQAFEVEALDYILKPFTPERLHATLDRVRARLAAQRAARIAARFPARHADHDAFLHDAWRDEGARRRG
ncbi:MAG: LytR/AlgR family response regulator transcription factor, partial [Gemmatimonadota bacterium]